MTSTCLIITCFYNFIKTNSTDENEKYTEIIYADKEGCTVHDFEINGFTYIYVTQIISCTISLKTEFN